MELKIQELRKKENDVKALEAKVGPGGNFFPKESDGRPTLEGWLELPWELNQSIHAVSDQV